MTNESKTPTQAANDDVQASVEQSFFNWSAAKFNNEFFDKFNAKINFSAKDISCNFFKISEIASQLTLNNQQLAFKLTKFNIKSGGGLKANINLQPHNDGFKFDGKANANYLQIHNIVKLAGFSRLYGQIVGDININSKGESMREIIAHLNGYTNLDV